ncbi:MAG: IclR family transcriptional regulator [Beijerinckiaceae bacterium]
MSSIDQIRKAPSRPIPGERGGGIQSVDRALVILDLIAESGGEVSLSVIAERAGLNVSTCHHLISTLANRGYVNQAPGKRTYSLGPRVLYLSHACLRQVSLPQLAQRYLDEINLKTGEATQLAVMQGTDLVTLLCREARHAVRVDLGLGGKLNAAHATATGKAILAWLPETERDRIIADKGLTAFTSKTITNMEALIEELRLVRRNGLAVDRQEFQPGVLCIGTAIRDYVGTVVGAISASVPVYRATQDHVALIRAEILSNTRELSLALGAPASASAEFAGQSRKLPKAKKVKLGEKHAAIAECENLA